MKIIIKIIILLKNLNLIIKRIKVNESYILLIRVLILINYLVLTREIIIIITRKKLIRFIIGKNIFPEIRITRNT